VQKGSNGLSSCPFTAMDELFDTNCTAPEPVEHERQVILNRVSHALTISAFDCACSSSTRRSSLLYTT